MKKPFTRRVLYLLPLLAIHFSSIAQPASAPQKEKFGFDFDLGLTRPTDKAVNGIFYTGLNAGIGLKMAILNNKKLWIKAAGGTKLYSKKAGDEDGLREAFRTWKAGIELQYQVAELKKFSFYPLLRVDHNWSSNYFSKTYDYDISTNSRTIAISDKYLKGTGYSFDAGLMIVRSPVYLKLEYEYYKPSLNVHPDFIKAALDEGLIVPSSVALNCSTLTIAVGINLSFK